MTHEEMKSRLYEKMQTEFEAYREQLLSASPQEILNHAYDYAIRDDIMETLEVIELTDAQMENLLKTDCPLADIVCAYKSKDTAYLDAILDSISDAADKKDGDVPI